MLMRATKLLAVVVLALAGCPKRVVVVNGQEMAPAQATDLAQRDLEGIRREAQLLPPEERAARLEAFADRYRETELAAEALHDAGAEWRAAGKPDRAARALGTLLTEHPLYGRAVEAKYLLALVDLDLGRPRDALATIGSVYAKLPDGTKPDAAGRAAEAALAVGADADAVRWLSELARISPSERRAAVLRRAADAVDRLPFLDVAKLREELPGDSPVQEPLAMKLARIHLHLRDYARAQEEAREVFLRWPDGPYAKDAKAIGDRIARLTFVRPNVLGVAV